MSLTQQQAIAQMVAYATIRSKASGLRTSLDTLKEDVGAWLDDNPEEPDLLDPATETRAYWQQVPGSPILNVAALDDRTLRWAADQGLLTGNMKAISAQQYTAPELLTLGQCTSQGPGYRKFQVDLPSWSRRQQLAENASAVTQPAGLRQTAQPPAPAPEPAPPTPAAAPLPAPTPLPIAGQTCPEHGKARHSQKTGAFFCPTKTPDGNWCQWSSAKAS